MFILSFVVTTWFFQRMFWLLIVIWEVTDQWSCVLPACSGLIYAHDIANVLVSVAWLFCLLLSWGDFFFKERFDWSWLWEDSYQWSLCLLVIVWFVLMTSRMCFGQWGMFYAFCCHEAILLKIDWWSRYKLFWLVELLIYLNNDFGFDCDCDCFCCYCFKSECPLRPSEIENRWHMMKNQNSLYFAQR